ncbi:MBL fold metallo-hydrolase [Janibacter terrae]|uniref:MBL fold metallo-hydrolase n=1 Tax=Janibacter terrae TaxID=103817 RepID=UPI0031F9A58E
MSELTLSVHTAPLRELAGGGAFSPTTATLITGPTEALLVDTGYTRDDLDAVVALVEASGARLTAVCITHAHPDHYLGLDALRERFPGLRAVAAPVVAERIAAGLETVRDQWRDRFPGQVLDTASAPEPLSDGRLTVDGEEVILRVVGQGDIADNCIVHVPSIGAVVAGDIVYNGVHPFLGASGPEDWPQWIASLDEVAALRPRTVVAGHKRPGLPDDPACVAETRAYIEEFIRLVEGAESARDVITPLLESHPEHANPSALIGAAKSAMKRKTHA